MEILSQFSPSCFHPAFSRKSMNFLKNPCFNFAKNQSFWFGRVALASKRSYCSSSAVGGARMSRIARNEAQDVLFDYLHCTRNLDFNDAEHISKNSPAFLQYLLSKVTNEREITRSLTKFLRYNPINEFEPFFESLGLEPSELESLLPRDLMFLDDDNVLLENFHVLCNYGVPRSKIGKLYQEATELFRYNDGVLVSKLRNYEELGLGKPSVIKLITCCPSFLIGVDRDFVCVLERLKSLGIQCDWISAQLSDESTYNWSRMLELMYFLDKMGCTKKDMVGLISTHPRFLFEDSGKKIYIVVALLLKLGLKMERILLLFLKYPQILAGRFAKNLWQAVSFLAEIGMETEFIANVVCSHTRVLGSSSLKKPRTVLSRLNVGPDRLCEIIKKDPDKLFNLASFPKNGSSKKQRIKEGGSHHVEKTTFLLSIGFVENSEEMVKALKQFRGRGDQLQERFDCLVNAGLDCHVVSNMIKAAPPVLNLSKDVIEMKIEYLVNHLGYPVQSLEAFPTYLCYDIEKIKCRFSMHAWLREKGIAKQKMALSTILACSDARFVKYFVNVHPEGPAVWEKLKKFAYSDSV